MTRALLLTLGVIWGAASCGSPPDVADAGPLGGGSAGAGTAGGLTAGGAPGGGSAGAGGSAAGGSTGGGTAGASTAGGNAGGGNTAGGMAAGGSVTAGGSAGGNAGGGSMAGGTAGGSAAGGSSGGGASGGSSAGGSTAGGATSGGSAGASAAGGSAGGGGTAGGSAGGSTAGGGTAGGGTAGGGTAGGGTAGEGTAGGGTAGGSASGATGGGAGTDAGVPDAGLCSVGTGPWAPHFEVRTLDGGPLPSPLFTRERLDITIVDLPPCAEVDLRFQLDGGFTSQARFRASPSGTVSTARDAPTAGAWSGTLPGAPTFTLSNSGQSSPVAHDLLVTAQWDGGAPFSTSLARTVLPPGTTITSYRETTSGGLYADFHRPPGPGPFPGVVVFGGSEGGLSGGVLTGSGLVRDGFAVLAIAYWNVPGKPSGMTRIPLETFQRATQRLRAMPDVRTGPVALMGVSRGGEAALLAGAAFPADVQAVVAVVPSGYAWAAPGSATVSTWTLDGGDVPFLPWPTGGNTLITRDAGYQVSFGEPFFRRGLESALDAGLASRAEISAEAIAGPVLLLGAGDDGVWPSCTLAAPAWARLVDAGHISRYADQSICFPGAGHSINPSRAGFPLADLIDRGTGSPRTGYGGSAPADDDANQALWRLVRDFLADALR